MLVTNGVDAPRYCVRQSTIKFFPFSYVNSASYHLFLHQPSLFPQKCITIHSKVLKFALTKPFQLIRAVSLAVISL